MGIELFSRYYEVEQIYQFEDEILGKKISEICFRGSQQDLMQTYNTQPAIFTTSVAIHRILKKYNIYPDCVAGYSLGEYTALYAAGVIDFVSGSFLVNQRAVAMERASKTEDLGMGVITGNDIDEVVKLCNETEGVYISNYNSDTQISISGKRSEIRRVFNIIENYGTFKTAEIAVNGAFHSPFMQDAMVEFEESLKKVKFDIPQCPIVLNNTGEVWNKKDDLKALMMRQMIEPVRWSKSVKTMLDLGMDTFIEIGPGRVLSRFIKDISSSKKGIRIVNIEDMQSLENAIEILNS
ncbi:ACP S-malonyltransferase [Anaerocolumna sp. AGMB13025]|uniref:ACP S-malonyltransferase n=1 Tax=Anaerocolumna sp. AGMB13025 TaxID=3039116 RepID=UPI00241CF2D9|nr:ACP S-malonyltransferase [Anaerocolumna sp. AGMB13025]WFR57116.1 ACP S-malonyltransferase [Anaerocolumna sp. AGMB13025]